MNTDHLQTSIATLQVSLKHLEDTPINSIEYEVYRNATIKGFELTLEVAGKLLRRALKAYVPNPNAVTSFTYKNILRSAAKYNLIDTNSIERWFEYRDNRNNTAHDYGISFAEETLKLLPNFLSDVTKLELTLRNVEIT